MTPVLLLAFAIGPIDLLGPTDVIALIDHLTRSDSKTTVDVKAGAVAASGKLLVARVRVDVALGRTSRNWRGTVAVDMTVPSEITYAIDLSAIKADHVRIDKEKKLLVIRMPRPHVEAVTPVMEEVKRSDKYKAVRFRLLDSHVLTELQNSMLLHDYQAKARAAAEAQIPSAATLGRPRVEEFLQRLLSKPCPGLTVRVE